MGKGGGGTQKVESTVTNSNLPAYAEPYYTNIMDRAEAISLDPYQAYGGQRIADMGSDRAAAYDLTRNTAAAGIPGMELGAAVAGSNAMAGQQLAGAAAPYQFSAGDVSDLSGGLRAGSASAYNGFRAGSGTAYDGFDAYTGFEAGKSRSYDDMLSQFMDFSAGQFDPTRQFNQEEADRYMSPYIQSVLDIEKAQAEQDYERARAGRSAGAVQSGAFGGSRSTLQEAVAENEMLDRRARIQAEGLQNAYVNAQDMFGKDRAAQFEREVANIGEQARVQQAMAAENARFQGAAMGEKVRSEELNIAENARVQGELAKEQARVQGATAEEQARVQQIAIDEASRVQTGQANELARVQDTNIAEQARVQNARLAEQARAQEAGLAEQARVQTGQANELARVQDTNIAEQARVQEARLAEQARAQEAGLAEQARVQDAQAAENRSAIQTTMDALGFSGDAAGNLVALGERARAGDIESAQLLESIGARLEGDQQAQLDMAYADFQRQRDYEMNQLNYLNSIMQGVPITPDTTVNSYRPYNPTQEALGAGIGALGAYKAATS